MNIGQDILSKARQSISAVRPSVHASARDTRTAPVTDTYRAALQTFNLSNMVIGSDVCWTNTSPFTKLIAMVCMAVPRCFVLSAPKPAGLGPVLCVRSLL